MLLEQGKTTSENVKILAPNENTLIVKLVAPTEHLPKILCHHAFSVVSQTKDVFSGAFQLTEHSDTHIVMTKNPHYWDAENVTLEKITFYLSDDAEEKAVQAQHSVPEQPFVLSKESIGDS